MLMVCLILGLAAAGGEKVFFSSEIDFSGFGRVSDHVPKTNTKIQE